jgi:acyl-CoA thioesterase
MTWAETVAVTRLGDHRFRAHVDEQWTSLQGVHGGIVAAIAVNASSTVLRDHGADPATQPRAATFGNVSGNTVGDLTVDIEIIRRGGAMTTTHARVTQGDKTTTVARLHHSTPWEGLEFSDVRPPAPIPDGAIRLTGNATRASQPHRDLPRPRHHHLRRCQTGRMAPGAARATAIRSTPHGSPCSATTSLPPCSPAPPPPCEP